MKNIIFSTIVSALVILAPVSYGYAAPENLKVDFEQTPLFANANIAPGKAVKRFVKITNLTQSQKTVQFQIRLGEKSSPKLSQATQIGVSTDAAILFASTVASTSESEQQLDTLAALASRTYYVTLLLPTQAGNDLQNEGMSFDIDFGFRQVVQEEPSESPSPNPTVTPASGGGGGGGALFFSTLIDAILGSNQPTPTPSNSPISTTSTPSSNPSTQSKTNPQNTSGSNSSYGGNASISEQFASGSIFTIASTGDIQIKPSVLQSLLGVIGLSGFSFDWLWLIIIILTLTIGGYIWKRS